MKVIGSNGMAGGPGAGSPVAGGTGEDAALAGMRLPQVPWLFGKLPAHGDFLARGIGGEARQRIDDWLSAEIARARARFGDAFEQRYFAAPPWHFVDRDPAGQWSGGALCPSVDGVGRKFPILLATPASGPEEALAAGRIAIDLACAAISQAWDANRVHEELGSAAIASATGAEVETGWAIEGDDGSTLTFAGRFPAGLVERMLEVAG